MNETIANSFYSVAQLAREIHVFSLKSCNVVTLRHDMMKVHPEKRRRKKTEEKGKLYITYEVQKKPQQRAIFWLRR